MNISNKILIGLFFTVGMTLGFVYFVAVANIEWKEILSILGGLSIFITTLTLFAKIYLDWSIKKEEIKFNKVFEHKLSILKEFIQVFSEMEFRLKNLRRKKIIHGGDGIELQEDWKELQVYWIKVITSYRMAKFFLKDSESKAVQSLYEKLDEIDEYMRSKEMHHEEIEKGIQEIPKIMTQFEIEIKRDFSL